MVNKKISISDLGPFIKEQIEESKEVNLTVSGNSMRPFFHDQKTIVTLKKITRPLKKKDVVFYQNQNGQFILHRIISIKKDLLIIRGDALLKKEYLTRLHMIAVVKSFKNSGSVINSSSFWYKRKVSLWIFIKPFYFTLSRIYNKVNKCRKK